MASRAQLSFDRTEDQTFVIRIAGSRRVADCVPGPSEIQDRLQSGSPIGRVQCDAQDLQASEFATTINVGLADRQNHRI